MRCGLFDFSAVRLTRDRTPRQLRQLLPREAQPRRLSAPAASQRLGAHAVVLRLAGVERGDLGGPLRVHPALGHCALDLGAPAAEGPQDWWRNPGPLGRAVVDWAPVAAEAPHKFAPKRRLVQIAAG